MRDRRVADRRSTDRRASVLEKPGRRLAALLEYAPLGLFCADPDGRIERTNRAFDELLGYDGSELRRHTLDDLAVAEDQAEERRLLRELREGRRQRFELEERCRRKDGRVVWMELAVASMRNRSGRMRHAVGAVEDITARKLSEAAIERLAFLVDSAEDAVTSWDLEGRITSWNRAAERLYGFSSAEAVGRPGTFHIPASRMLETIILRERLLHGEAVLRVETERLRKDGTTVEVSATISPIRDASGRVIGASAISRDLTERRKADEVLQRLAAIVRSASDAITATEVRGRVTEWNEGAERLYGWKAAEMLGRDILLISPPEGLPEMNRIREEIWAGRRVDGLETRMMRKDGTLVEIQVSVAPVRDARGTVIGTVGVSHDISARKRAEQQIRRINAELETRVAERTAQLLASNLELESFNAAVSHDLRGPLSIMRRSLDVLAKDSSLGARGRDWVARASRSARRMDHLIDDMMQLARCRGAALRRETVDVSALARGIIGELKLREPGRRVDFVCEPGLSCRADRSLLKAALENLLGNAWKFTGKKERARIELGCRSGRDGRVFFVADDGAGFDMAYAPKLFRSFTRLHTQSEFEGTGVGLSIVRSIVERHGGRVWANAAVGRGATFYFTLPD